MKVYRYFIIALIVIIIDQASKLLVHKYMYIHDEIYVLGDWFRLHYLLNPGMAFGIRWESEFGKLALTIFRILAMFGIAYYLVKMVKKGAHNGFLICMALILGGAVGNVIDSTFYGVFLNNAPIDPVPPTKWFHGQVIDMLYFPIFKFQWPDWVPALGGGYFEFFSPVFNIADSSIFMGVVIILIFQHRFFTEKEESSNNVELLEEELTAEQVEQRNKEHYYRVFFGEGSDYYMYVKKKLDQGKNASFNFFACFCGPLWLICRKMYLLSAAVLVVDFGISIFLSGFLLPIFGVVVALFLGFYGNNFYIAKADSIIEEVMTNTTLTQEEREVVLRRKGGVTYITSIIIGLLFVVLYYFLPQISG